MGRPLNSEQTSSTVLITVNDHSLWTLIRKKANDEGRTLTSVVEEALNQLVNVRQANT